MDTTVTVIQVLLGSLLSMGGVFKLIAPYATYTKRVPWARDFKPEHIRLIGVLEASGGIGLIVPLLLPALTLLTVPAAVGVALYMAGAMATHLRRLEYPHMLGNLVFLGPALLVAYGRLVGF